MPGLEAIEDRTFSIQYCPNCPSRYLIRTVGEDMGRLDNDPDYSTTRDKLHFGATLEDAIAKVLSGQGGITVTEAR